MSFINQKSKTAAEINNRIAAVNHDEQTEDIKNILEKTDLELSMALTFEAEDAGSETVQVPVNSKGVSSSLFTGLIQPIINILKKKVTVVNSIANLPSDAKEGDLVLVKSYHANKDLGGGTRVFRSARRAENDKVICINGWVLLHNGSVDATQGGALPGLSTAQHVELKQTFESCRNNSVKKMTLTPGTYLIGDVNQDLGTLFDIWGIPGTDPKPMNDFHFDGRGAILKQIDGLKFGTFTGTNRTPFTNIFNNTACSGVIIENLEIDGNNTKAVLGAKYGDHGWQIPNYGIRLISGKKNIVRNVKVHHMLLDGLYLGKLNGTSEERDDVTLTSVYSEYNGRQGLSVCGVRGLTAVNCKFNYTGQAGLLSAPAAGIDFENELGNISDCTFINCELRGNMGHDIHLFNLHGDFDIAHIQFIGGRIVAEGKTTNPFGVAGESCAIAVNTSTDVSFENVLIAGKILREAGGSTWLLDSSRLVTFNKCFFTTDPNLTLLTLAAPTDESFVDCGDYAFKFSGCTFRVKDRYLKLGTNSTFIDNTIEASFTKKLSKDFIDVSWSRRFFNNLIFTFDSTAYGNTINWTLWNNKTNNITNGDAPLAIKWTQSNKDGLSYGIISLIGGNANGAYITNNNLFEQEYRLSGVNLNATYPDAYGTAKFYHTQNGEGNLILNLTNYSGVALKRTRTGNVWNDFSVV